MADTGFVFPGTTDAGRGAGSPDWVNPDNIKADNDTDATWTEGASVSPGLAATNFDFSVIPAGATIDGVEVRVDDYRNDTQAMTWNNLRLILADDSDGSVSKHGDILGLTTTDQTDEAGGSTDLWSETISRADVQDVDWGFFVKVDFEGVGATVEIDSLQMKVYYTGDPSPSVASLVLTGFVPIIPPSIKQVGGDGIWTDGDTNINIDGQYLI